MTLEISVMMLKSSTFYKLFPIMSAITHNHSLLCWLQCSLYKMMHFQSYFCFLLNDDLQLSNQGILQKSAKASLPNAISKVLIWSQKFMRKKKVLSRSSGVSLSLCSLYRSLRHSRCLCLLSSVVSMFNYALTNAFTN